jgi:hypothetical protein
MFHRFSCGCVGIIVPAGDEVSEIVYVIQACERTMHDDDISCHISNRSDDLLLKTKEELRPGITRRMLNQIGELIKDGYRYREIKRLLS